MWTAREEATGSARNPAELVVMEGGAVAAAMPSPAIANLNVTKSSKVHIGPKFVSVTQNVQNAEMLKGRFLGLDLVSTKQARRLRCSVAVFVCWALLVASGLIIYLIYVAMPGQRRLDIELPLPKYVWHIIKNSTRTERLSCAAALVVLLICVGLIGHFSTRTSQSQDTVDRAPDPWNISREMWLGKSYNYTLFTDHYEPLLFVVVQNTVGPQCHRFDACAAELRNLQNWYLIDHGYDIPYNFAIGNDGRVYENRGWGVVGAHTLGFNACSIGLGFLGDYREDMPNHASLTTAQENHTRMLLEEGVRKGHLRRDFIVVGGRDLTSTASPGSNLYNAIRRWRNYDHQARFKGLTCDQIHQKYGNVPLYDVDAP